MGPVASACCGRGVVRAVAIYLQGKYGALVKLINDCTVDGSDTTALSTYWTDSGLKESQAAVAALITKIEAAQTPVQP